MKHLDTFNFNTTLDYHTKDGLTKIEQAARKLASIKHQVNIDRLIVGPVTWNNGAVRVAIAIETD